MTRWVSEFPSYFGLQVFDEKFFKRITEISALITLAYLETDIRIKFRIFS